MDALRPFRPGQMPDSRQFNDIGESLQENAFAWGEGIGYDTGGGGLRLTLPPDRMLWIRLTAAGSGSGSGSVSGSGTNRDAYSWEEVIEIDDGFWVAPADGRTGTATGFPAYEAQLQTDIPPGTVVLARVAVDGLSLRFQYCPVESGSGSGKLTKKQIDTCLAPCDSGSGSGSQPSCASYGYGQLNGPGGVPCCVDGNISGSVTVNGGIPGAVTLTFNGSVYADSELTYTLDAGRRFSKLDSMGAIEWQVTLSIDCSTGSLTGSTMFGGNTYDIALSYTPGIVPANISGSGSGAANCPFGFKLVKKMQWFDSKGRPVGEPFCEDAQQICDEDLFCNPPDDSDNDLSDGVPYPESLGNYVVPAECTGAGTTIPGTTYFTFTTAVFLRSVGGIPTEVPAPYLIGKSIKLIRTSSVSWCGIMKLPPMTWVDFQVPGGPCYAFMGFTLNCSGRFSAVTALGAIGTNAWGNLNNSANCPTASVASFSNGLKNFTAPCQLGECAGANGTFRYATNLGTGSPFQGTVDALPVLGWAASGLWPGINWAVFGVDPIRTSGVWTV